MSGQFSDWHIAVGRVLEVEEFPEARKPAWKLLIDFGGEGRLWSSAQVTNYSRDELLGRLVVGVTNVGVRRIAGFESRCLILGVEVSGTVKLLEVDAAARPGDSVG